MFGVWVYLRNMFRDFIFGGGGERKEEISAINIDYEYDVFVRAVLPFPVLG